MAENKPKTSEELVKQALDYATGSNGLENHILTIEELKHKYKCVVIDLPGFGKNKPLTHPYMLDDYIADILLFISSKNFKITHIVAHSFGGKLAIKLSLLLKIKGLILNLN